MLTVTEPKEINMSDVIVINKCASTCPHCGSPLYYTRTGCLCRENLHHKCEWNCEKCNPRMGVCK